MRGVLVVVLLAVAARAHAQSAAAAGTEPPGAKYAGRVISNVRLLTEGRAAADPGLLDLVETRRGQPLAPAAVRESIAHLFTLGRFEDIQVDASEAADGVELTYNLIPLHIVDRVEYEGNLGLPEGLLRRTIRDRFGATPRPGRRDDMTRTLEELYRDRGYYRATIRPVATVDHDPDRTLLTFEIDAGPRARIGSATVAGDPLVPEREFRARVNVAPGEPYRRVEVQQDLTEFLDRLRQKGHYEATGTHRATVSPDGLVADLVFDVHAGPVVSVRYEGDPIPRDRLEDLVTIEREGSVDEDLLEDIERRIEGYLHSQGYWKARVTHVRQEEASTLAVVFRIERGVLYRVATDVEISGNRAVPTAELRPLVKIETGDVYVASNLDAAANAISDLYRRRGFAAVKVDPSANETDSTRPGEGPIRPVIVISEGPRTVVGEIQITGNARVPESELRKLVTSAPGDAFYAPRVAIDRDAILFEYLNRGYASADVNVRINPRDDSTRADIVFDVREGPQTIVDHVLIVGNTRTKTQIIQRELLLRPGQPLGLDDLAESQRRLSSLGLFRRVRIADVAHGSGGRRDVLVTVEEASATTIEYGGGVEGSRLLRATGPGGEAEEDFAVSPRGFFDIGRRNLFGKNRSVNLYTRVSLRPNTREDAADSQGSAFGFSDYRVVAAYRQPRMFGPNDTTFTAAVEQGVRSSFNFSRKGVTAESFRRLTQGLRATARYSLSTTKIFDERFTEEEEEDRDRIDRLFPRVRLGVLSTAVTRDTRDDVATPQQGAFLSGEGSIAARALGGELGFMKTYLQAFWFRRVPRTNRVTFASRIAVGLADGFEREVTTIGPDGNPVTTIVEDLPASERFFAGGDTTIRGFALDSVGADNTISASGFPRGGNAVILMNGELRIPVWGSLATAVFIDSGNVFARVTQFDITDLRGGAGVGIRYMSPVGPIRVDVGFKLDRRPNEHLREIHFSFGHAF